MLRFVLLAVIVSLASGQTLTILSQYKNAFVLNGVFQQTNTMAIQCFDTDYGIWRYLIVTKADNTASTVGLRCNAPTYIFTKTLVGYIPEDGTSLLFSNCLLQNPYNVDPTLGVTADISRAPTNPGEVVSLAIHRRKQQMEHRNDEIRTMHGIPKHRKCPICVALVGGIIGGYLYCTIQGCGGGGGADQKELDNLNTQVGTLQTTTNNLVTATNAMAGQITTLFTAQSTFATTVSGALDTTTQLFNQQLALANASLAMQQNTTDYLTYLNGGLTQDLGNLHTQLSGTQDQLLALESSVSSGFNVTAGNLANVVRDLNLLSINLTTQINTSSTTCTNRLGYLRARLEQLTGATQAQIAQLNDLVRNTQARRNLASFIQANLQGIIDGGYTPFLANLGSPPSPDTSEFVWKINIEVSRVLYIRNNAGLSAQMLDVNWYCNTGQLIAFGSTVSSFLDVMSHFGPSTCNATLAGNCTCWAVSQRYSCPTTTAAYNHTDWFLQSDLRASNICTGAVVTNPVQVHVTLDSLLAVFSAVCNDGTWNNANLRVLSGMMGRSASVPYNPLVCTMVFDTLADVTNTGLNFMYAVMFYLQLSFSKVYVGSDIYAKYLYGTVPDSVTTIEDPLATINGSEVKCFYSTFMSYNTGVQPMLPVYRLDFVSSTMTVSMTINNVSVSDVSQVTQSVPDSIVLPPTGSFVAGEPADPSTSFNIPFNLMSASPSAKERCGSPTYPMVDDPANFTVTKWGIENRAVFDHFCGTNVASYYKRTLNGQGLCTGTALIGEGSLCTIRQDFVISSVAGGVEFQPRVGTSSSGIVDVILPDGNVTSIIFSSCPSVSLSQTAPNVATLTLGNPQPTTDITVAIVLTGDCAATTPSFTIPANQQKDFLIPLCLGKTTSFRAINIFRYDSTGQLQPCGNTTNFTVDRQTFINQFTTPDIIQTNITAQLAVDSNQLAIEQSLNNMRGIMANMMITQIQAQLSTGIQFSTDIYTQFATILTQLQYNGQLTSDLANATRNTQLYNYDANLAAYVASSNAYVAQGNATLNASRALLNTLAQQAYNASSLAAQIAILTNSTNNAVNNFANALDAYANATLAALQTTVAFLNSIHFSSATGLGGLSDFFGGIGSFLINKVVDPGIAGLVGGIEYVAKQAVGALDWAEGLVDRALNGLLGLANGVFQILWWVLIAVVGVMLFGAIGGAAYLIMTNPQLKALLKGDLRSTDLADYKPPYQPEPKSTNNPNKPAIGQSQQNSLYTDTTEHSVSGSESSVSINMPQVVSNNSNSTYVPVTGYGDSRGIRMTRVQSTKKPRQTSRYGRVSSSSGDE